MIHDRAVEAFFGSTTTATTGSITGSEPSHIPPSLNRSHLRLCPGVWSEDDVEVAHRIVRRHHNRSTGLSSSSKLWSDGDEGDTSVVSSEEGESHPPIGIPKHIHFVWLGPKTIPPYPDLTLGTPPVAESYSSGISPKTSNISHLTTISSRINNLIDIKNCIKNTTSSSIAPQWNGTMRSWRTHHPPSSNWSIHLWTTQSVKRFHSLFPPSSPYLAAIRNAYDYAMEVENYGMASDIVRLELLEEFGGLYVDVDYYCVGRFDDLHDGDGGLGFYCGASNTGCVEINNGLIGCQRGHGLVRVMMEDIAKWWSASAWSHTVRQDGRNHDINDVKDAQKYRPTTGMLSSFLDQDSLASFRQAVSNLTPMDVIRNTGPGLLTQTILRQYQGSKSQELLNSIAVFPCMVFHPLPNAERSTLKGGEGDEDEEKVRYTRVLDKYVVVGETKAVHLWGCSWQ